MHIYPHLTICISQKTGICYFAATRYLEILHPFVYALAAAENAVLK